MKALGKTSARELPRDFATLCVADVMQRNLVTVHASDPIEEVERVLAEAKIGGVPVLDDNEEVIGILSMSDLVNRYAEDDGLPEEADYRDLDPDDDEDEDPDEESTEILAFRRPDNASVCAGDVMTADISFVSPSASLREAAGVMVRQHIHRLLVVERGRAIGILSTLDILRAIAD
jgi:CBS domain-containing protein